MDRQRRVILVPSRCVIVSLCRALDLRMVMIATCAVPGAASHPERRLVP